MDTRKALLCGVAMFLFVFLLVFWIPKAKAWEVQGEVGRNFYGNDHIRDEGVSGKLMFGNEWIYLWGSYDDPRLTYGGQHCGNIALYGAGVGLRYRPELLPGFSFWVEGGWYWPNADIASKRLYFPHTVGAEGLGLELNKQVKSPTWMPDGYWWEWYEYLLEDDFGGGIGISYNHYFTDRWSIGVSTSYHYLHFDERIRGMNANSREPGSGWWEVYRDFDMSHWNLSAAITYRW